MTFATGLSKIPFIKLRKFSSSLLLFFLFFFLSFICRYWDVINAVKKKKNEGTDSSVELSLNKAYFVHSYVYIHKLLDSICQYFIWDFCHYTYN